MNMNKLKFVGNIEGLKTSAILVNEYLRIKDSVILDAVEMASVELAEGDIKTNCIKALIHMVSGYVGDFRQNVETCHHAALLVECAKDKAKGCDKPAATALAFARPMVFPNQDVHTLTITTLASMQLAEEYKAKKDKAVIDNALKAGEQLLNDERMDTEAVLNILAIAWAVVGGAKAKILTAQWYNVHDCIMDIRAAYSDYTKWIDERVLPSELIA